MIKPHDPASATAKFLGKLLIATDGTQSGDRAVEFAIALAERFASELDFCNAFDREAATLSCCTMQGESAMMMPLLDELEDTSKAIVRLARERAIAAGVVATAEVLFGSSVGAILACANGHDFDAVVLGTAGTSGIERFFEGSTADGVLRRSTMPVFVVPPGAQGARPSFMRILVAADDSDPSDAAVAFAIDFAAATRAQLVIGSVAETKRLMLDAEYFAFDPKVTLKEIHAASRALVDVASDRARERGIQSERYIVDGPDVADAILTLAKEQRADLIVLGTHGRRGLQRLFVGSVAETIVRRSSVPVAVVRARRGSNGHTRNGRASDFLGD
jgi:nucleotide-binding universal stress UspA family protein